MGVELRFGLSINDKMILKFDKPMSLQEARETFNDFVKFVTTTESYPAVSGVEFDCDAKLIFKREAIEPKVHKQADKIINKYSKRITRIWNRHFKNITSALQSTKKAETFSVGDDQRLAVKQEIADLTTELADTAERPFTDAFKLGKIRGQVLSNQDIDDDLDSMDEQEIENQLDENEAYLAGFSNDLQNDLDLIMEQPYESSDELIEAVRSRIQEPKKSRALMYAFAALGALVAGTVFALRQAKEEAGHRVLQGGIWTVHPDEGQGGPICDGCEENSGQWFNLEEFLNEYQTNDCLIRCRCDLRYLSQRIAP